ncbi:MAG: hypothetical protein HYZ42_15330, partial [Bacteroidetes bacterium]|nr:hypothetical protein [Bacteroidota bacterium]
VYMAEYDMMSQSALSSPSPVVPVGATKELFMSLPTDKTDYRLPLEPELDNITKGLAEMDECNSKQLYDADGYSLYEPVRYTNIIRHLYDYEIPFEDFFQSGNEFFTGNVIKPVSYGLKYVRKNLAGNVNEYIGNPPFTAADENSGNGYQSYKSNLSEINETVPYYTQAPKIFTHAQRNTGQHHYWLYAVNWFSRASVLSNEKSITTDFSGKSSQLKPPSTLAVQYIQKESPRVFTTQKEQDKLADKIAVAPNADNCFLRVNFNWTHLHNIHYQTGKKVEFFYRDQPAQEIRGLISSIEPVQGSDELFELYLDQYTTVSGKNLENIEPIITNADKDKFIGTYLICKVGRFLVSDIIYKNGVTYPVIIIRKNIETNHVENPSSAGGTYMVVCSDILPTVNSDFHLLENLKDANNWKKLN